MPFKDVDLAALNRAKSITQQLGSKVAVIDKLNSDLTADKKLATVELLTGRQFQPSKNPIKEAIKEQETSRNLAPVLAEIGSLRHAIQDHVGNFGYQQLALPAGPADEVPAIDEGASGGVDLYERYAFTGDDLDVYQQRQMRNLNEVAVENDQTYIASTLKDLTGLSQTLGGQKSGLSRRRTKSSRDIERLAGIQKELSAVKKYKDVLRKMQQGKGLIKIGGYVSSRKRLKRDNILSVRYDTTNKMVPNFGSKRVSDNVKKVVLNKTFRGNIGLSKGEKDFLDKLYLSSGEKISPSKSKLLRGSSVFTSLEEIMQRAEVLLGELTAGNTSVALKNELSDLLHYLYQHKKIRKDFYTKLISVINKQ